MDPKILKNKKELSELDSLVLQWNLDFPIDRWWRKTHGVAFNSLGHREVTIIDMAFEFLEDELYKDTLRRIRAIEKDPYKLGTGNFLVKKEVVQDLSDEAFEKLDIDSL
jgi:hypothetical protein